MRMIDKDALIKKFEEAVQYGQAHGMAEDVFLFGAFINQLENETVAPTIEAEPVKHERWENVIESVSVMSCTGFPLTTTAETCTGCLFRSCFVGPKALLHDGICPNCGAKMDGG